MAGDGNGSGGSSVRQFGVPQRSRRRGGGSGDSDGIDPCTTNVAEAISRGGASAEALCLAPRAPERSFLAPSTSQVVDAL